MLTHIAAQFLNHLHKPNCHHGDLNMENTMFAKVINEFKYSQTYSKDHLYIKTPCL